LRWKLCALGPRGRRSSHPLQGHQRGEDYPHDGRKPDCEVVVADYVSFHGHTLHAEIKVLKQAFKEAWWIVAAKTPQDRIDVTRVALAHAVIAHALKGERDVAPLTASALNAV
jgi:hypothetical protein